MKVMYDDMGETTNNWEQSGFTDHEEVTAAVGYLKGHMAVFPAYMQGMVAERLLHKPSVEKWSRQEILGHLVDSAVHNLTRFTGVPFAPTPYVVKSYRQAELVTVNRYQTLPLPHLLVLWESLNRQILFVIEGLEPIQLALPVDPGYGDGELHNLGWLFCDYVAHLEHHLKQIYA
jgi:hypothetical protein